MRNWVAGVAMACLTGFIFVGHAQAMTLPAKPLIVEDLGKGRAVVDGHRSPRPWARQTLGHLVKRWGEPDRIVGPRSDRTACVATWRSIGVVAYLANYGGADACSTRYGQIQELQLRGGRWRTSRGLALGNRAQRIARLYPKAKRGWNKRERLLRPYTTPCVGDCGAAGVADASAVHAVIRGGRVAMFRVAIYAAGD